MAIDSTQLKLRIRDIIGDQQGQFDSIIDLELSQAVLNATRDYTFYWNTEYASNIPHTNGALSLPTNAARIIHISDSDGNLGYFAPSTDRFYIHRDALINGRTANKQFQDNEIPFILNRSSDGTETVTLADPNTPATRTFNIAYTKFYTTITPTIPDTMYMYLLGETAFNLMNDTEDADLNLINRYKLMADRSLRQELKFSNRRDLITNNQPATPSQFQTRSFSNGI
jgi:hypothetical protein